MELKKWERRLGRVKWEGESGEGILGMGEEDWGKGGSKAARAPPVGKKRYGSGGGYIFGSS